MKVLSREYWWVWLLMLLFGGGMNVVMLGILLDIYQKDAWYAKGKYWLIGILCFFIPALIMMGIFCIESLCKVAAKLEVPYYDYYLSPYLWILLIIFPIIGWFFTGILLLYLNIMVLVKLYQGKGEKYSK